MFNPVQSNNTWYNKHSLRSRFSSSVLCLFRSISVSISIIIIIMDLNEPEQSHVVRPLIWFNLTLI